MRRGGGKRKGSSFERLVARDLSRWLTRGKLGKKSSTQLIRSVLSGGWSAGQSRRSARDEGWRQVGDLAPNGPAGEAFRAMFAVECKHRKDIRADYLWSRPNEKDGLVGWWKKLTKDCKKANVLPLLIYRANKMPTMVASVPLDLWKDIPHLAQFDWLNMVVFPFSDLVKLDPQPFMQQRDV